jgi:hypothetical protein
MAQLGSGAFITPLDPNWPEPKRPHKSHLAEEWPGLRTGGDAANACLNAALSANNLVIGTDPEAMR